MSAMFLGHIIFGGALCFGALYILGFYMVGSGLHLGERYNPIFRENALTLSYLWKNSCVQEEDGQTVHLLVSG
jgi:hypothetical protein